MKTWMTMTAAVAALAALSVPASAQVLGGNVTGNVGAAAGVQTPGIGDVTGTVGDAAQGAADLTQDTTGATTEMLRDSLPAADVSATADVQTDVSPQDANAAAEVSAGAMVHTADGAMLGRVIDVTRDTTGRIETYVIRTADGAERLLPSASARIEGDAVIASGEDLQSPQQ